MHIGSVKVTDGTIFNEVKHSQLVVRTLKLCLWGAFKVCALQVEQQQLN